MAYRASAEKTAQVSISTAEQSIGAGPGGAALAPPAYGMDVLDRASGEPAFAQEPQASLPIGTVQMRAATSSAGDESPARPENRTGLPDTLKAGIESLSGLALDNVRVHYNSPRPAQLQALAYAQGTDIYVGPGQQRHLPHEAWHVVQQKQGRVQQTMQLHSEIPINNDAGLEREADIMGAKALEAKPPVGAGEIEALPSHGAAVVQCVRGGLEFTENQNPGLRSYPVPLAPVAGPIGRTSLLNIEGTVISAFVVPAVGVLGNMRNTDHTLAVNGQVSLTNDVTSAEWVIARHGADVTADVMLQNLTADVDLLFEMRDDLAHAVNTVQGNNVGSRIVLAPGTIASLDLAPDPEGVFVYYPGNSRGTAQITVQYTNADAIKRINLLNASKYLQGTKVASGEDVTRVSGTEGWGLTIADAFGTTSFSQAHVLLAALAQTSNAVQNAALPAPPNPAVIFSAEQVALVKLMVLNDAMAATMTRHAARLGQSEQKNIQRFFPKSRRDEYSRAVARRNVNAPTLVALCAEINQTAAADAQLYFNMVDPSALRTAETTSALGINSPHTRRIIATGGRLGANPPTASAADITHLKTHVLGANGALLATWIGRGARAYTDTSVFGTDTGHYHAHNTVGNVIRSTVRAGRAFTPVARNNSNDFGAVYEFREREIAVDATVDGRAALLEALNGLFTASG